MRKRSALFAVGALVLLTKPARAKSSDPAWTKVFINPGIVASWSFKPDTASGAGFEISGGYYNYDSKVAPHVGGVFRTQGYNTGPWGSFSQNTIALEGGLLFGGVEVGWAFRSEFPLPGGNGAATNGFHILPYLTLGIVYVGPQILIPVNGAPVEVSLNLGFKLPVVQIVALGALAASGFGGNWGAGGRPLRVAGRARSADLRRGRGWKRGRSPRVCGLAPHIRTQLAAHWADEARAEHASVATFAKLVLELLAVGAPASLVRRAQRAAADEIRHAEICFRFASAYAGVEIEPGAIETGGVRKPSLARMAVESFLDGVLGEGLAAATLSASESDDPVVRNAVRTIARDEARHAALGRAIVRWCEKTGGAPVKRALRALVGGFRAQRSPRPALGRRQSHGSALGSGRLAGAG